MHKMNKGSRQSPQRDRFHVGHLEETPPVQRRNREVKLTNENRNNSNLLAGLRLRPEAQEACEFECDEDYIDFRTSTEDFVKRSINIQPSSLSQSQEALQNLTRSQENILRKPRVADKNGATHLQPPTVHGSLTFGSLVPGAMKSSLNVNREFLEDKKIKNEILDEIIKNANKKNNIMKSQDFGSRMPKADSVLLCANHDGKKAKYRIAGDSNQNMFYCSKCSILLLQQGYNVEEINQQPTTKRSDAGRRRKDVQNLISKVETAQSKYKTMIDSLRSDGGYDFEGARGWLEETYEAMMYTLEQMKVLDLESLMSIQRDVSNQQKRQKAQICDKYERLESLKEDLEQIQKANLGDLSESKLSSTLENYSNSIKSLEGYQVESVSVKLQTIEEKLSRFVQDVRQNFHNQSESKLLEESSIISKLEEKLSDIAQEQDRKPFRNLFTEQEQSQQSNTSNFFNGELSEDESTRPKFKKFFCQ